jgi:hypothetical protein
VNKAQMKEERQAYAASQENKLIQEAESIPSRPLKADSE